MLWPLPWDDDNWRSMFYEWGIYYHALTVVMRRWQMTEHDSNLRELLSCFVRCDETMTTEGACFIDEWYIIMRCSMSWDDDNWRSMIHTFGIYNHALTVVIGRCQLTEHVSYLRDYKPCSDRYHETITTDRADIIPKGCITMLSPLSWDSDNWRSMFHR